MGGDSRREYLATIRQRYSEASKEAKGLILQEFCAVCDYHRKHAIRLLKQHRVRPRGRPGRNPVCHSPELLTALKRIWLVTDQMCSKRLVAAIPFWLPFYEKAYPKLELLLKYAEFFRISLYELTGIERLKGIEQKMAAAPLPTDEERRILEAYKKLDPDGPVRQAIDILLSKVNQKKNDNQSSDSD